MRLQPVLAVLAKAMPKITVPKMPHHHTWRVGGTYCSKHVFNKGDN